MPEVKDRMLSQNGREDRPVETTDSAGAVVELGMKTVLVMLDNQCPSPCYCFGSDRRDAYAMSAETLNAVLEWAAHLGPTPPAMLFMVGAPESLDAGAQAILQVVAGSVICASMHPKDQASHGVPFSDSQLVVFSSLGEFEEGHEKAMGRSCVVHVGCEDVPRLSSTMKDSRGLSLIASAIQFRPQELHRWDHSQLQSYRNELIALQEFKYRLRAAGVPTVRWRLIPSLRCPAMENTVAIGPDGLCYPCPAFYYAGQTYGLGPIATLTKDNTFTQSPNRLCRLCQSAPCEACLFWEAGLAGENNNACELVQGMDKELSQGEIIKQRDVSGYLFATLKTMDGEDPWINQGNEQQSYLFTDCEQMDDLSRDDFTDALKAIHGTLCALTEGKKDVADQYLTHYGQAIESIPKAWKSLFAYDRLAGDLEELVQKTDSMSEGDTEPLDAFFAKYDDKELSWVSRKVYFLTVVRRIIRDVVVLSEAIHEHRSPGTDMAWYLYTLSQSAVADQRETLSLSAEEVTTIERLYERLLGWEYLCTSVQTGMQQGFDGLHDAAEAAKRKVQAARRDVRRWFDKMIEQHEWKPRKGYSIAIDFDGGMDVSHACYKTDLPATSPGQGAWSQIMPLEGPEMEVYERIAMLVEERLSRVKEGLQRTMEGSHEDGELEQAVSALGQGVLDVKRWYRAMAAEHDWPRGQEYRVNHELDMVEARPGV